MSGKGMRPLSLAGIQLAVGIYAFSAAAGKLASGHPFISVPFILFYGLEILCLGVYALLWQQIIKRHELSVAYVNRSLALVWSMAFSALIFKETITPQNLVGVAIVIAGVLLVNTAGEGDAA